MNRRFESKVVLVTGAAGGIGLAAADAFAQAGARVMLVDRDGERVRAAAGRLRDAGLDAAAVVADVCRFEDCRAMVEATVERFGALHIAFNNAGISGGGPTRFDDLAVEDWDRLIGTNLSAVFYAMKAEVPALKAHGGQAIVNTASVTAQKGVPGLAGYVASKHGVLGLTKVAALDLVGDGIRVNAVCPGFVQTPMLAGAAAAPGMLGHLAGRVPMQRIASPEEVARTVLFLASSEAAYVTGAGLYVDGGLTVG